MNTAGVGIDPTADSQNTLAARLYSQTLRHTFYSFVKRTRMFRFTASSQFRSNLKRANYLFTYRKHALHQSSEFSQRSYFF